MSLTGYPRQSITTVTSYPERNSEGHLAKLAQVKALISAIDSGALTNHLRTQLRLEPSPSKPKSMKLSAGEVELIDKISSSNEQRTSAWYKPSFQSWRKVWIEWKSLQPSLGGNNQGSDPVILNRFEALVQLLRECIYTKQFRTLRCMGYYIRQVANETPVRFRLRKPRRCRPVA